MWFVITEGLFFRSAFLSDQALCQVSIRRYQDTESGNASTWLLDFWSCAAEAEFKSAIRIGKEKTQILAVQPVEQYLALSIVSCWAVVCMSFCIWVVYLDIFWAEAGQLTLSAPPVRACGDCWGDSTWGFSEKSSLQLYFFSWSWSSQSRRQACQFAFDFTKLKHSQ